MAEVHLKPNSNHGIPDAAIEVAKGLLDENYNPRKEMKECPKCGNKETTVFWGSSLEVGEREISVNWLCCDCGVQWNEHYKYHTYNSI